MRFRIIVSVLVASLAIVNGAEALNVWFSTSNVVGSEGGPANPTVNTTVGQSQTIYVWASPTVSDGRIIGLPLACDADIAGKITATGHTVFNPMNSDGVLARWDAVTAPNTQLTASGWSGDNALAEGRFTPGVKNSQSAPYPGDPGYDPSSASYLISSFTFTGAGVGTTHLLLKVGPLLIVNDDPSNTVNLPVYFGSGDTASAFGLNAGSRSTTGGVATPDATINVTVPEPASASLLMLAALGLQIRSRSNHLRRIGR